MERWSLGITSGWILLALVKYGAGDTAEELKAECLMWSHLENKTLPLQDDGHAKCVTNEDCTGFSCDGMFKGSTVSFGIRVHQCQEPPGLEIFGDAPQFLEANFSHIFQDGAKYQVPPAIINLSNLSGIPELPFAGNNIPGVNLYFKVNLEPTNHNETFNTLKIGLEFQACMNHSAMGLSNANIRTSKALDGGEICPVKKPLFKDATIPVPHCESTYPAQPIVGDSCSINEINSCGPHQTCTQQSTDDNAGTCECLSEFSINPDKSCGPKTAPAVKKLKPSVKKPKSLDFDEPEPQPHTSSSEEAGGSGYVVAGVVSTLIVLAMVVAVAFLVKQHRLIPRMQAKMRNTPYEDIIIGESTTTRIA